MLTSLLSWPAIVDFVGSDAHVLDACSASVLQNQLFSPQASELSTNPKFILSFKLI
jgi:hypothetical protein